MLILRLSKTAVFCLVVLLLASSVFAERIYTTPSGDGQITNTGGYEYGTTTVNRGATSMVVSRMYGYPFRLDTRVVSQAEISIASLAGMNLAGYSITYNFYALGGISTTVSGVDAAGDGAITESDYNGTPTFCSWSDSETTQAGWIQIDAKAYVASQLAQERTWASFHFEPTSSLGDWRIATAEDTQGRASYIEVMPVPEPSSLVSLFTIMSGLGAVIIRRRT